METKSEKTPPPEPSKPTVEEPITSVPLRQRRLPASFWQEPSRLPENRKNDLSSNFILPPYTNQLGVLPVPSRQQPASMGTSITSCPCSDCFLRTAAFYYPVRWTVPYHPAAASNIYSTLYCQVSPPCRQPCKICESLGACHPSRIGNRKNNRFHPLHL